MTLQDHSNYREEVERLEYTVDYIKNTIDATEKYKDMYKGNIKQAMIELDYLDSSLSYINILVNTQFMEMAERNYHNLVKVKDKPYFARIDFKKNGSSQADELYIGKASLLKAEDNSPLIIDWRSPVANLYYEGRLGEESYKSQTDLIDGELLLKRQFTIEKAQLENIFDIDITTTDEFLQASLEANADNKLKDIASTIQAEQNRVIRAAMDKPLIVQGAAGSGKTTIALHRIAFFIYTYEQTFDPENFMIIAPNRLFMDYISQVLPELGVERVKQTTYTDFAEELIGRKYRLANVNEKLIRIMKSKEVHSEEMELYRWVTSYKSSLEVKVLIDRYIREIENEFPPNEDFIIYDTVLLDSKTINKIFLEELNYLPIYARIKELKKSLSNKLKYNKADMLKAIEKSYDIKINHLRGNVEESEERRQQIVELIDKRDQALKNFNNESKKIVKAYLEKFPKKDLFDYYLELMTDESRLLKYGGESISQKQADYLSKQTKEHLENKKLELEDYALLVYLKHRLFGFEKKLEAKSVVIDEAQDFSIFQIYVLREILNTNMFTLLGDLSQGIHSYRGVRNWKDVLDLVFANTNPNYMTLVQSYRTTVEVMNLANEVIKQLDNEGTVLAKPVIRHGDKPEFKTFRETAEMIKTLEDRVIEMQGKDYKSTAIICKSIEECKAVKKLLDKNKRIHADVIDENDNAYRAGVMLIPSYISKGLEFDVVIIVNHKEKYLKNDLDIKLLYVAMTRTLHRLFILAEEGCMGTLMGVEDEFFLGE